MAIVDYHRYNSEVIEARRTPDRIRVTQIDKIYSEVHRLLDIDTEEHAGLEFGCDGWMYGDSIDYILNGLEARPDDLEKLWKKAEELLEESMRIHRKLDYIKSACIESFRMIFEPIWHCEPPVEVESYVYWDDIKYQTRMKFVITLLKTADASRRMRQTGNDSGVVYEVQ